MKNADLFKDTFGTYATEIWSMPENDFLKWLNEDVKPKTGHWIPVSERLPEAGEYYLCCDANGFVEVGYLSKSLGEWFANGEPFDDVIAWMPLPEPYKAESEDKE